MSDHKRRGSDAIFTVAENLQARLGKEHTAFIAANKRVELLEDALRHLTGLVRDMVNVYDNYQAKWITEQKSFKNAEALLKEREVKNG